MVQPSQPPVDPPLTFGQVRVARSAHGFFVGDSAAAQSLRDEVERAAASEMNLLVTGETGVGKSLVAERVHQLSQRRQRPFVVVEPTALPMSLFESEIFGHARGAYTGATAAASGAFEAADGGTLFLDEIGDLPLPLQVKLLRAVEAKAIRRVGDVREIQLDVRLITATNRDLEAAVRAGTFRDDLFHRLNEIRLNIPPLRQRRQDVVPLLKRFVAHHRIESATEVEVTPAAATLLAGYAWPGNVRELRTLARRLVERGAPTRIDESTLIPIFPARIDRGYESDGEPEQRIWAFRRRVYLEELAKHSYDIRAAARALGIPYATLRSRLAAIDLLDVIRNRRADIERGVG
jgi:transcriptional regulator with PAS, ATPase and Fis domain